MRCLFCGKKLPLFKRLTRGEFCSDTHRQQYHQEYSQLALNRLLQAQPAEDGRKQDDRPAPAAALVSAKQALITKPALTEKQVQPARQVSTAKQASAVKPAPAARPTPAAKPAPRPSPTPSSAPAASVARNGAPRSPDAAAVTEPPTTARAAAPRRPEAAAPAAVASMVKYRPPAAPARGAAPAIAEMEPVTSIHREIPLSDVTPRGVRLERADRLSYKAIAKPPALPWRSRRGRMEIRDFSRTDPILDLGAKLEEPWMEAATEPVKLSFTAAPSRTQASPRMQPHREFGAGQVQVGELAALDLATTGFETSAVAEPVVLPVESAPAEEAPLPESVPSSVTTPTAPATPAARDPEPFTQPMPIVVAGIPGSKEKPVQMFASMLTAADAVRIPRYDALPLRPKMVLGRVDTPSPKTEPAKIESAGPAAKTASTEIPVPAPVEPAAANLVAEKDAAKNPAPAHARPAAPNRWATKTSAAGTPATPARAAAADVKLDTERKPSRELPGSSREQTEVAWEQIKLNREQAELNRQQAELNRQQAELIREQAKAAPAASASPSSASTIPAAPAAPRLPQPEQPAPEPARGAPISLSLNAPPAKLEKDDLGLPKLDLNKVKERAPLRVKITAAAACAVLLTGGIWFYTNHNGGAEAGAISSVSAGAGPEWIENFSPDARHPRTISVLRASTGLSDYTIEFSASVDVKAAGWVFRAQDPANFYVGRIEEEKTLGGAVATFVYFPVVRGVPQERKRSPVTLPAGPGTVYKIRFEASGERFTAWIQDRKIEEWTDGRLLSGGAGLYSESGERALLQGDFRVIPRAAAPK